MKAFILVIALWASSLQAESLQEELQGLNAIGDLMNLMYQFEFEYASQSYVKSCQTGRKILKIGARYGANSASDDFKDIKSQIDTSCKAAQNIAAKNMVNCAKYKLIKFTCAGVANFDNCMTIRFGDNYAEYESICL